MGQVISFETITYAMAEEGYVFDTEEIHKYQFLENYIPNICYEINRNYYGTLCDETAITNMGYNYAVVVEENQVNIINIKFSNFKGLHLTKAVVCILKGSIGAIWLYLPEIVRLVLDETYIRTTTVLDMEYLNTFRNQEMPCIREDVERFIRQSLIPCNLVATEFSENIWGEGYRFFSNNQQLPYKKIDIVHFPEDDLKVENNKEEYLAHYEKYVPFYFTYQIPSVKNRPKEESYFVEKKRIKSERRNNKLYWKLMASGKNTLFSNDISFQINQVEFNLIKAEIDKMVNMIEEE